MCLKLVFLAAQTVAINTHCIVIYLCIYVTEFWEMDPNHTFILYFTLPHEQHYAFQDIDVSYFSVDFKAEII